MGSDPRTGTGVRPQFDLVEAGAGNGRLARDILDAAQNNDPEFYAAIRLSLVEQSPTARAAQREHARTARRAAGAQRRRAAGRRSRRHLRERAARRAADARGRDDRERAARSVRRCRCRRRRRFVERFEELSTPRIAEYLARAGAEMRVGWRAEVNLRAEDWTKTRGRVAAARVHGPDRLRPRRARALRRLARGRHADVATSSTRSPPIFCRSLAKPTSPRTSTLSAVTRAAERCRPRRARAARSDLLHAGPRHHRSRGLSLQQRLAMKTLLLPGGLGSTHKVLIFGRGVGTPALKGARIVCGLRRHVTRRMLIVACWLDRSSQNELELAPDHIDYRPSHQALV